MLVWCGGRRLWAGQGKAYKGEDGSGGGSRRGEERWKRVTGDLNPEAVSLYRKPSECQSCPKETPPKDPLETVSPGNPQIREEARNAIPPLPYTFVIKGKHTHEVRLDHPHSDDSLFRHFLQVGIRWFG